MRYIAFDRFNQAVGEGELPEDGINCPDGGSVSIEVSPGKWLHFNTSEWGGVAVWDKPASEEMIADLEKTRTDYAKINRSYELTSSITNHRAAYDRLNRQTDSPPPAAQQGQKVPQAIAAAPSPPPAPQP